MSSSANQQDQALPSTEQEDKKKFWRTTKKEKKKKSVVVEGEGDKKISMPVPSASNQTLIPLDIVNIIINSGNEAVAASAATTTTPSTENVCPLARSKQEKEELSEQLAGGITAFRGLPIDILKKYITVIARPTELTADALPKIYSSNKEEFCICAMYAPQYVDAAVKLGLLPMTIPFSKGLPEFLAPKLHKNRCIIRLPTTSSQQKSTLHLPEGIRKKSKKYALLMDGGFWDVCCKKLVEQHEREHSHSWLNPYLQRTYKAMNVEPEKYATNIHAVVVVRASDVPAIKAAQEQLHFAKTEAEKTAAKQNFEKIAEESFCAGEIGCSVGTIYTSLTGGYVENGTGSIQLGVLAALLLKCGYETWDLGMAMDYKTKNLGGIEVRRNQWIQIAAEQSKRPPLRRLGSLDGYVVRCDKLIDSVEYFNNEEETSACAVKKDAAVAA